MKPKNWLVLVVVVLVVILFFKVLITKNKAVDIKNINEQSYMKIESDVFPNDGMIPVQYTCYGDKTQIPLKISGVPQNAKSLGLIVDDPDAPNGDFVHWVVWNIEPETSIIENNNLPGAVEGNTSLNKPGWVPPCPPSGTHHYNFKLYALDTLLSIPKSSNKVDFIQATKGHVIDYKVLIGLYGRK